MALRPNPYLDFHRECIQYTRNWTGQLPANLQWLNPERVRGLDYFETINLPTRKTESWKYTPISSIVQGNILHLQDYDDGDKSGILVGDFYNINIVNGHVPDNRHVKNKGEFEQQDAAFDIIPFATDNPEHQELIRKHLNKAFEFSGHPFATWNASILQDGILIRIKKNMQPAKPICVNHINRGHQQNFSSHTRILLVVEAGSTATVIENFTDHQSQSTSMNNALSEIYLEANSELTHFAINGESTNHIHTGAMFVRQQANSQLTQHNFATGSALKRRDIQIKLLGPQADCKMFGAYLIGDRSHVDYHTTIEHVAPHCSSEENFKGIVTDQGKAVFNGRIHIHRDAQQSDAQMNNKNLLLTNTAEVNTKPELEIYADDVKCAHGATVGQVDENALYYFQSRGISRADANRILSHAFIEVIIKEMKTEAVQHHVQAMIQAFFEH
jgi:Fe-S cluster assembly protein SufD